jgi:hypothetical protein
MAAADDKRREIEAQINKLSGDTARYYRDQLNTLTRSNAALSEYNILLSDVNDRVSAISEGFGGIHSQLTAIVSELKNTNTNAKDITSAFSGLRSVAQKLKHDQQGITDLNKDQLKKEKSKIKILQDQLKAAAEIAKEKQRTGQALSEQEQAVLAAEQAQYSIISDINALLDERIKQETIINRKLGVTGVLLAGMSKIPIVGPLLKTNEALDAAREKAKAGGNMFQTMGAGLGSMAKNFASSFADPLVSIGLIVKAFKFLLDLGFKVDGIQTKLAKSFSLSADSSKRMYDSFNAIQATNEPITKGLEKSLLNTTRMAEAANELGQAFEGALIPTRSQIENQIILTKEIGLSVEEANELQKLAFQNGMTTEDITKEVLSQTKSYRNQTGVQLNNKKILQDVSKISGQLRLQYGNSTKQLIAATIQANKLGLSLEQTKKISESLLNFEESIENELSAELLINRDLNLEQARLLALNGKSAEATALIAEQMGGSAEFSKLNVIQQEALAKALGMSADELANSMIYQEQLSSLGSTQQQQIKDQIKALEDQGRLEEAQQLQRDIANGKSAEEALLRIDEQTKFNESVDKLKMMLADIVDGPALKLTQWITSLTENANTLKYAVFGIVGVFAAIKLGGLLLNLASMAALTGTAAAGALTWAGGITLGIGLIGVVAAIAAAMSAFNSNKEQAAQAPNVKPPQVAYATGGIVGGNSTAGDNVSIRANSGEMILNKNQQSKLFNMINGGGGGGGPIQVTVYGQIDKKTLFTFMAEGERTNSNNLGAERQVANRTPQ